MFRNQRKNKKGKTGKEKSPMQKVKKNLKVEHIYDKADWKRKIHGHENARSFANFVMAWGGWNQHVS